MHAAANAVPLPTTSTSLANRWIKANVLAAITIPLTAGVLPILVDRMFPGLSETAFSRVSAVVGFVAVVVCLTVYATLTASVLREKLPAFSRHAWIAGHVAFAAALGLIMAKAELASAPNSAWAWYTSGAQLDASNFLFAILIFVPLIGALLGGLQGLVLRSAAHGTRAWIAAFAIGSGAVAAVSGLSVGPIHFPISEDVSYVVRQSAAVPWVMLLAVIMLPAFNRLTPRG